MSLSLRLTSPSPLNLFSPSSGPEPPSPLQTFSSGQLPLPPLLLLRVVWPCPCVHRCSCYCPSKLLLLFPFWPPEERRTACSWRRSEPGRDDELHFSFRSPENTSFSSESPPLRRTALFLSPDCGEAPASTKVSNRSSFLVV